MSAFSANRVGWQVKRLHAEVSGLSPRGGASICSTSVGIVIFGGANRDQVAFDDFVVCTKPIVKGDTDSANSKEGKKFSLDFKKVESTGDIPQPRSGHACVAYGHYMFLFGGIDFAEETGYSDLYCLNLLTWNWRYVGETGAEIEARNSHSLGIISVPAARDVDVTTNFDGSGVKAKNYLVVFGGASPEKGPLDDTFFALLPSDSSADIDQALDKDDFFVHWIRQKQKVSLRGAGPSAREMHGTALTIDPGASATLHGTIIGAPSMVIAGGRGYDTLWADVWELRPVEDGTVNTSSADTDTTAASTTTERSGVRKEAPKIVDITEALGSCEVGADASSTIIGEAPVEKNEEVEAEDDEDDAHLLQWVHRHDLTLTFPRCAHACSIVDCRTSDSPVDAVDAGDANILTLLGGFIGESIAEDVASVHISSNATRTKTEEWRSTKCGANVGGRFGTASCVAPKWLLDAVFPQNKSANFNSGAMLVYGGINIEKDFNDLLLFLPPTM